MSYYSSAKGKLIMDKPLTAEMSEKLNELFDMVEDSPDGGLWLTAYEEDYDDDEMTKAMKKLAPFIKTGSVEFTGEDAHWRFRFSYGEVSYEEAFIEYERVNAGYKIIAEIPLNNEESIVIGHNEKRHAKYVVWYCRNQYSFGDGGYCATYQQAMEEVARRITLNMSWIMKGVDGE